LAPLWAAALASLLIPILATADDSAIAKQYDEQIKPLLTKHCFECHATEKPKGDLRLDKLSLDFADDANREIWATALERIKTGEMPPKEKPRLSAVESQALLDWIRGNVEPADAAARAAQGRVVLRRLNRQEYQNTIRDLLAVDVDLTEFLPEDSSAGGFDNVGDALHTSSFLMERYLDAADKALSVAIANLPQPPLVKKRYTMDEERIVKTTTESVYLKRDDALVMFSSSAWNSITVGQFYPPDRGKYRVQISCYAHQSGGKPVVFRVDAGPMLMATKNHMVDYFDAKPDEPTIVEFMDSFEARNHFRISPYGLATAHVLNKVGAEKYDGPGLAIQWIDVEGPLHDAWPPESHRRIFGDLPQGPAPAYNQSKRVEVVSENPVEDARRILKNFARRAFRRPVSDDDVQPLVKLVEAKMAGGHSFELAVRAALKGVLVSPGFLFLREPPGQLDDFALASRLSYFLWSSMPDEELFNLAAEGKLSQPDVLRGQVERLLKDENAAAFTENFVGQWLALRDIDFTEPSHLLYPEYDAMLRESMVKETQLFFAELLKDDLSLTNFVSSEFAMLNGRLAKHYGIPDVDGWEFRKVALPPDSHRGGVLTMGSVLKVTANGTTTSPVMRGAWVLDRILGTPAPPPPADVPVLEPDIRGATTIREQLAKHRQVETCASCHTKIDPPGFALESFDVIGGYREHYRTTGSGGVVMVEGRRMPYHQGKPVDPSDVLPDGRAFKNIDELKQLLLADKDQLARALTTKLLTYATGARPTAADHSQIEVIVGRIRDKEYGVRSLVHEIVQSEAFRHK
jgi:mono/diheme cytochrome c family protein